MRTNSIIKFAFEHQQSAIFNSSLSPLRISNTIMPVNRLSYYLILKTTSSLRSAVCIILKASSPKRKHVRLICVSNSVQRPHSRVLDAHAQCSEKTAESTYR